MNDLDLAPVPWKNNKTTLGIKKAGGLEVFVALSNIWRNVWWRVESRQRVELPDRRVVHVASHEIFIFEEGKVREHFVYNDPFGVMQKWSVDPLLDVGRAYSKLFSRAQEMVEQAQS